MRLFVECKPDEVLVTALGYPSHEVEHAAGRDGVCRRLQQLKGVFGMVDDEPQAHPIPYLRSLTEVARQHDIRVLEDRMRGNRVIVLSPRFEPWLVRAVKQAGLRLTDYGFEDDNGKGLHSEINQRLPSLRDLIAALLAKQEDRILTLQRELCQPRSS